MIVASPSTIDFGVLTSDEIYCGAGLGAEQTWDVYMDGTHTDGLGNIITQTLPFLMRFCCPQLQSTGSFSFVLSGSLYTDEVYGPYRVDLEFSMLPAACPTDEPIEVNLT